MDDPKKEETDDLGWASGWATSKKDKKKKGKVEEEPAPEPEPEKKEVEDSFGWGSFGTDKKKKQGKISIGEVSKAKDTPAPEPEKAEDDDMGWGASAWGKAGKKDKKTGKTAAEEPVKVSVPLPRSHDIRVIFRAASSILSKEQNFPHSTHGERF